MTKLCHDLCLLSLNSSGREKETLKQSIELSNEMIDEFRNMCSLYVDDISYVIYSNKNDSSICIKTQDGQERCSVLTVYIKSKMKYDLLNLDAVCSKLMIFRFFTIQFV